jgi:arylformamidase
MKIIDLTYPIEEGMLTFEASWHPRVSIQQLGRLEMEGRESREVVLGTHTGTHTDSPLHFISGGLGVDQLSLETLIGPVSIIDFSYLKENETVTKNMIKKIKVSSRMLFKFGWGVHWGIRKFYHGYPYFETEAAELLVKKGLKLIGYDIPSPDDSRIKLEKHMLGGKKDSPVHKIFLKKNVILVEYVANLHKVTDYEGWNIAAMPLKIKGADGSPARVCIFK